MQLRYSLGLLIPALAFAMLVPGIASAKVSAQEAAKLGTSLTPIGANPKGNDAGTIPKWVGGKVFPEQLKSMTYKQLEEARKEIVEYGKKHPGEDLIGYNKDTGLQNFIEAAKANPGFNKLITAIPTSALKPRFIITSSNYKKYADKLAKGYQKLFQLYPDYKMIVYPSVRDAYFPDFINKWTKYNATHATLEGTDGISGAKIGYPFPIPQNGAQVIWNHKLSYRGKAAQRYNDQEIVSPDGSHEFTQVIESANFPYNTPNKEDRDENMIAHYLEATKAPPRVAGQYTLVHEIFGKGTSGRNAWLYNPGLGRVVRAPKVGYDTPAPGTDGMQFDDQVDMYNGSLSRYTWKLIGKKEMIIPYNSYLMSNPIAKYTDIMEKHHINQNMARYELHRVWVVEADLKQGERHQFGKRVFYIDEDSWRVINVDCYDDSGDLWRFQEGHIFEAPFIPTTADAPEVVYDLKSGRYFLTALMNQGKVTNFEITYPKGFFSPSALKRQARNR